MRNKTQIPARILKSRERTRTQRNDKIGVSKLRDAPRTLATPGKDEMSKAADDTQQLINLHMINQNGSKQ